MIYNYFKIWGKKTHSLDNVIVVIYAQFVFFPRYRFKARIMKMHFARLVFKQK